MHLLKTIQAHWTIKYGSDKIKFCVEMSNTHSKDHLNITNYIFRKQHYSVWFKDTYTYSLYLKESIALIWCMSPLFKQANSRGKIKRVVNETKYFCYCPHIHFYVGIMFFFLKNESKVKRAFFSNNLSI